MGWGSAARPTPAQQARTDLAHELDVALHGHATFEGAASESRWLGLLDEVRTMSSVSIEHAERTRLARVRQGLG